MPLPVLLLLLATLLPLISFAVLVFVGKRMGTPLAGYVGTAMIAGSFAVSLLSMALWLSPREFQDPVHHRQIQVGAGQNPVNMPIRWLPVGESSGVEQDHPGFLDVGIYIDSLTIVMFVMITTVGTLVHVFSLGYMHEDPRYSRFFAYLALFCFAMLALVIAGTLLQIFVFWELVGLGSYLLIGFWYEKKSAANAATKAFVINRIGDFGFLIGFGILFYHVGNATLPNVWGILGSAAAGHPVPLAVGGTFSVGLLTVMGIALFFGAIGKSAQFPLHVWLPDAMEGPTPASALIHAATMVAAGVYLIGRLFPILTPDARLFIAIIGLTTLTLSALIAIVQTDIKRVLAYSTISQLGYMMLAMGVGSWVGGLFHLITHAFFKSLLFLATGSVIYAAHHEQELAHLGGLMKKIPVTAITFAVAVLAMAGAPPFSGYYSKEMILRHAGAFAQLLTGSGGSHLYWIFFVVPAAMAYVTAFYLMRIWMLTFWGKPRDQQLHERATEAPIMYVPLIVLALLSILGGRALGVKELLKNSIKESTAYVQADHPDFNAFSQSWAADLPTDTEDLPTPVPSPALSAQERGDHLTAPFTSFAFYAFVGGIALAFALYCRGFVTASKMLTLAPLRWLHRWLVDEMYFNELYFAVFAAVTMAFSYFAAFFDRVVVDGIVRLSAAVVRRASSLIGWNDDHVADGAVAGMAALVSDVGVAVRASESGRIRMYVTALMLAVILGLAGAIVMVLSH
jgi:proton-translocating NADH-quinone oxidoreductase chain L